MRHLVLLLVALVPTLAAAECKIADVSVRITKAQWVNPCTTRACYSLKGAAVLKHACPEPVGIQVRMIGMDKTGSPIAVREMWPFSTRAIAPGTHAFPLDSWLDYNEDVTTFDLHVVQVERPE